MSLVGLRLRTSVTSTIYKKSLKLSNASRKAQTGIVFPSLYIKKSSELELKSEKFHHITLFVIQQYMSKFETHMIMFQGFDNGPTKAQTFTTK